jgi:hypothetical protein
MPVGQTGLESLPAVQGFFIGAVKIFLLFSIFILIS